MKEQNDNYKVVNTKVAIGTYNRLYKLARKKGISVYELVQMVCDTLIRYMDDRHNLDPDMEQAMSLFEHMIGWRDAFNLADPSVTPEIHEATYYVGAEGKKGVRAVHVERPFFGNWCETTNVQNILEKTLCLMFPERYRRLRLLAVENDCNSILELLDLLIDRASKDSDVAHLREEFEDADRNDYGRKPHNGEPFVRHHQMTLEDYAERERKSEEARQWLEYNTDFKPFAGDW